MRCARQALTRPLAQGKPKGKSFLKSQSPGTAVSFEKCRLPEQGAGEWHCRRCISANRCHRRGSGANETYKIGPKFRVSRRVSRFWNYKTLVLQRVSRNVASLGKGEVTSSNLVKGFLKNLVSD